MAVRRPKKAAQESRLFDRELSWLEWNARVLEMAGDERVPLLERLRFTAIFSSNLDEFCMVRVAELLEAVRTSPTRPRTAGDLLPSEVLDRVGTRMRDLVERQSAMLGELLTELRAAGIAIMPVSEVMPSERGELAAMFHGSIFPVLTPLAVGPGRPFPYISNLSLSLGVMLRDPETGQRRLARVKVPEVLPRFLPIGDDGDRFVTLEDLIATHLDSLFPGMEIEEHAAFRVTRDADFEIEEAADDLLSAVERELRRRRFGEVVRVELANSMSAAMRHQLLAHLHADEAYVYAVDGLLDLADLVELTQIERPELRYPEWQGVTRPRLRGDGDTPADLFAAIREGDIFVEHPYDAFSTSVERLFEQAVDDPDVLAIKHTIYRTSGDSPMVPALIRAAEQGKQAVVLVELKARFDEARNIGWARALERAGVHVVHGFPALKTHAKCALVVRREQGGIRRYVHIGTGNYHPRTARLYTDAGLFTLPARHRRRRLGSLQLPDRIRAPAALSQAARRTHRPARAHHRRGAAGDRGHGGRGPGSYRPEDERPCRPTRDRVAVRGLAGRRRRSISSCAASAASGRECRTCPRTSASSACSAASSSTSGCSPSTAPNRATSSARPT